MALITVADVAKATGLTFTSGSAEEARAQFYCDQIEAYIADKIGALFAQTDITERCQANYDGIITLRHYPVNSVDSVKKIDGSTRSSWEFDGISEVDGLEAHEVVDIEYNAGFTAAPAALKQVAIAVAARQVINPDGKRQVTVGAISETFAAGDGSAGTIFFTPMENEIIDRYCESSTTWHLGPRNRNWRERSNLPELYP